MILWRNIDFFFTFYHFDSNPRFPPFLLYVRWKSGVNFVRRCFRDVTFCDSVRAVENREGGDVLLKCHPRYPKDYQV